jgi:hypothetical protein
VPLDTARVASAVSVAANATYALSVLGSGGVPTSGVSAIAFALIAKGGTAAGKLEVYPSGTVKPAETAVDYRPSVTMANMVFGVPGSDGKILVTNTGSAAMTLYVDVAGYFASPSVSVRGSSMTGRPPPVTS